MEDRIPLSFQVQWINTTLKFVKSDNQLIMEYPEMPVHYMEHLHHLIWQHNSVGFGFKSMYSSLWEAIKIFSLKYAFKVFVNTSEDGNTGRLVVEKVLKNYQENDKPANEEPGNSRNGDTKKMKLKSSDCPEHSPSKTKKSKSKEDKFFKDSRKIIDSISPALLRKGLQKILNFLYSEMDASLILSDLAPIEAKFFENFLGIYNRRFEFQNFLSPACNDMLENMCKFFKDFDKECKLEVYPNKQNMDFKKREVTFLKVPRYTRNNSKSTKSPVLKTTTYADKAFTVNNASSAAGPVNNVPSESSVIKKKISLSSPINNMPTSTAINSVPLSSSAENNISSTSTPATKDNLVFTSNATNKISSTSTAWSVLSVPRIINNVASVASAINKVSSSCVINNVLESSAKDNVTSKSSEINLPSVSRAINNVASVSSAINKASTCSVIKNLASVSSAINKASACSVINNVASVSSAINKVSTCSVINNLSSVSSAINKASTCSVISNVASVSSAINKVSTSSVINNVASVSSAISKVSTSSVMNNVASVSSCINKMSTSSVIDTILVSSVNVPTKSSAIINLPSYSRAMNYVLSSSSANSVVLSASSTINKLKSPTPSYANLVSPSSSVTNIQSLSSGKNNELSSSSVASIVQSTSDVVNKLKGCPRKEKLMKAMSKPLESEKGLRMMRLMGWEGGALGLRGDGLTEPIMPALHIVPGAGLGHEPLDKTKANTTKTKTDTSANKTVRVDNRLDFLTNILHLLQSDKISSVTYSIQLAKKEKLTFFNITNALNMRSHSYLTDVENLYLMKIEKIMAREVRLSLRLEFSPDMRKLTIVKTFDEVVTSQGKNKKQTTKIISDLVSKDQFKLDVCAAILDFIRCQDREMKMAFDAFLTERYVGFVRMMCKCVNRKVLIPFPQVINLAIEILRLTQDCHLDIKYDIKEKYFVLYKMTESTKTITKPKQTDDRNNNNSINMKEQKRPALLCSADTKCEEFNKESLETQVATTVASSSKISALNNNILCEQIDSVIEINKYDLDKKSDHEFDEINDLEEIIINDDETNQNSKRRVLGSRKSVTNMSLSVLGENKEDIDFTQKICQQIDFLLTELEKYETSENARAKSIHKYVDSINNNETAITHDRKDTDFSIVDADICQGNNIKNLGSVSDVVQASSNRTNDLQKVIDENINALNLCREIDSFINDLDDKMHQRNGNNISNKLETATHIFLVDVVHSDVDEKLNVLSREDRSEITPLLIQDNDFIGDFKIFKKNSDISDVSKGKEINKLNNLKTVFHNIDSVVTRCHNSKLNNSIYANENEKSQKHKVNRTVISNGNNYFENINQDLIEKTIEALTLHYEVVDCIEEIKMHKEKMKINNNDNNIEKDHLNSTKLTKISNQINMGKTYMSRKWYEHCKNFLKCDQFVKRVTIHDPNSKKKLESNIEVGDMLMKKDLKRVNVDSNIYPNREKKGKYFQSNNIASTIIDVIEYEPTHGIILEEISVKLKNLKVEPENCLNIIDKMEVKKVLDKADKERTQLGMEPEQCWNLMSASEKLKVLGIVEKGSPFSETIGFESGYFRDIRDMAKKETLERAGEEGPELEITGNKPGDCHFIMGKIEETLEKAKEESPKSEIIENEPGDDHQIMGVIEEYLEKAKEENTKFEIIGNDTGDGHHIMGIIEETLEKAKEESPKFESIENEPGDDHQIMGIIEEYLEKAKEENTKFEIIGNDTGDDHHIIGIIEETLEKAKEESTKFEIIENEVGYCINIDKKEILEKVQESIDVNNEKFHSKIEIESKEILNKKQRKISELKIVKTNNKDNEDIKRISESITNILSDSQNISEAEIKNCHEIMIIESVRYKKEELKIIVQTLIQKNVALVKDFLPLLRFHGVLHEGIVYSCYSEETCLWLKRVLIDFKVKDYRSVIDKHRMSIRVTNFNEKVNLWELLELYYGIKSHDWPVIYEKQCNDVLIFGMEMDTESFEIVFENNFSLFVGFDVAQFSIGF